MDRREKDEISRRILGREREPQEWKLDEGLRKDEGSRREDKNWFERERRGRPEKAG